MRERDKAFMVLAIAVTAAGLGVAYWGQFFLGVTVALFGITGVCLLPGLRRREELLFQKIAFLIWAGYAVVVLLLKGGYRITDEQFVGSMAITVVVLWVVGDTVFKSRAHQRGSRQPTTSPPAEPAA